MGKPPCYGQHHASAFQETTVADAYAYRPSYPPAVFDALARLLPPHAQRILDAGCGTGALARHFPPFKVSVDAVDVSIAMVTRGQQLPNGTHPRIRWHIGPIETVALTPPYDLITAGDALHWMDWYIALPRFAHLLTDDGKLVILELGQLSVPWSERLRHLIQQYSTIHDYQAIDLIVELINRGLFVEHGRTTIGPWPFRQSLDAYVESFHGRASLSRERLGSADAQAFDSAVRALVRQYNSDELELPIIATMVWGKPLDNTEPARL